MIDFETAAEICSSYGFFLGQGCRAVDHPRSGWTLFTYLTDESHIETVPVPNTHQSLVSEDHLRGFLAEIKVRRALRSNV